MKRPNVLFVMTDQQRFDTIAALGNEHIHTPNFDRLVGRGVSFVNGYSTCPVCVPARYTIRTGCEPATTGVFSNLIEAPREGQAPTIDGRCGPYLAATMRGHGYRTFGIGKFHTAPWDEDLGYDVHLHSEELYANDDQRSRDGYAGWIAREHPEVNWIDMLHGERTEMYYMPQMSPLPAELTVEAWAAARAAEQIADPDARPFFGFVSFIGPHPPLAPPQPFNRMYHPDHMPNPVRGDAATDHMDEMLPWMNHIIWAEDINDPHARVLKARYYGEISYIDQCLGHILDAVEARDDADNTLICFFADHGEHLGDHSAWQKESFFDASCRVPFLLSWPERLPRDVVSEDLVCLTDLFGIATTAAGQPELRDGHDILGALEGAVAPREHVIGTYGTPGTDHFKMMVREGEWKYIWMAHGGREQLFNLTEDPGELRNRADDDPQRCKRLREVARSALHGESAMRALEGGATEAGGPADEIRLVPREGVGTAARGSAQGELKVLPYSPWPRMRIQQFCPSRGFTQFPEDPADAIKDVRLFERERV